MNTSYLANRAWQCSLQAPTRAFLRACHRVEATQADLLKRILQANGQTVFGKAHRFEDLHSYHDYAWQVPPQDYRDLKPYVERIGAGEQGVLTGERVKLLEPTSGTSGAHKLIPYTAGLQQEFNRGIGPWIADLFRHHPKLLGGRAYWSVSPAVERNYTSGGLPIGFEDDTAYLSGWQQWLAREVMAVPSVVRHIADIESFYYVSLWFLLQSDLRLVSVWNPTFWLILLEHLTRFAGPLLEDLHNGKLNPPQALEPKLHQGLRPWLKPWPKRARALKTIFGRHQESELYRAIWPNLTLISAWGDAGAKPYFAQLKGLFPQVHLQPKGLLSTEGMVSFPLVGHGAVLAHQSHFFEFVEAGGKVRLAHLLEAGQTYEVMLTTSGGLYRYQLHDRVEVVGFYRAAPLLRFVGKSGLVVDHFGEKLEENHVREGLEKALLELNLTARFYLLACRDSSPPAYTLFIESPVRDLVNLQVRMEQHLLQNFHYAYCRKLGQLGPLQVQTVHDGQRVFLQHCQALGQKAGDVKPVVLHPAKGWEKVFGR